MQQLSYIMNMNILFYVLFILNCHRLTFSDMLIRKQAIYEKHKRINSK